MLLPTAKDWQVLSLAQRAEQDWGGGGCGVELVGWGAGGGVAGVVVAGGAAGLGCGDLEAGGEEEGCCGG